jgi:hypothetical protein
MDTPSRIAVVFRVLVATAVIALPAVVTSQDLPVIPDTTFQAVWTRVRSDFAQELNRATITERQAVFVRMIDRLVKDPQIASARNTPAYQKALQQLIVEHPDSALAQSVNAPLTNPVSNQVLERSGFSDLIALSADARKLFSADNSAVTINLNAVALLGGGMQGNRSAPYVYSRREGWRRLGGTFTFGGKIPERELTGISGIPSADTMLDAVAWDVKVRVVGDRDPRAARWYPLLLGEMGTTVELITRVVALPGNPADVGPLLAAADVVAKRDLAEARRAIASSLQVSVKVAGQHITEQAGMNKYAGVVMLDKGFKGLDVTGNVIYSAADAPALNATDPFRTRDLQFAAGLTGSVLKDAVALNRAIELTAAISGRVPLHDRAVPIDRKRVVKANVSVALPFQTKAKIPISVTYSNDPNNLTKEHIVSGQVGFSYDFGAIWGLLK